jgi:hypothetical protein
METSPVRRMMAEKFTLSSESRDEGIVPLPGVSQV